MCFDWCTVLWEKWSSSLGDGETDRAAAVINHPPHDPRRIVCTLQCKIILFFYIWVFWKERHKKKGKAETELRYPFYSWRRWRWWWLQNIYRHTNMHTDMQSAHTSTRTYRQTYRQTYIHTQKRSKDLTLGRAYRGWGDVSHIQTSQMDQ